MSSSFKMSGKVHTVINDSGTTKKGDPWNKRTVVIDNGSDFNNLIPIVFFGERMENAVCNEGDNVDVTFYVGGREWQGKYFADISGDKLDVVGGQSAPKPTPQPAIVEDEDDSLPF